MNQQIPPYDLATLQQALAQDPRTAELGVEAHVRGDHVFLEGTVGTEERKKAIGEIAARVLAGVPVHNDLQVEHPQAPDTEEELT